MNKLYTAIEDEAAKLIRRHESYAKEVVEENRRRARRSNARPETLQTLRPSYWSFAPGFNPYLVRSRSARISAAINRQLRSSTYVPKAPAAYVVGADTERPRPVCVYQ